MVCALDARRRGELTAVRNQQCVSTLRRSLAFIRNVEVLVVIATCRDRE